MNKKGLLVAGLAALGVLLFAGGAKAAEVIPVPPEPEPGPGPRPPSPPRRTNPPNISGDPEGYNTQMFKGPAGVRQWFVNMGYALLINTDPVLNNNEVKRFQRDYNAVSASKVYDKYFGPLGTLDDDGTAGVHTLNALEIANALITKAKKAWVTIVQEAS